jgi:hypothetical protein
MSKKELVDSTTRVPAEIRKSFGPPPVLNSDDIKIHDAILCGLAQAVRPRDFFEWMYLHDLADVSYQIQWLRRLKVALIRQSHKENLQRFATNVTAGAALEKQRLRDRADREAETKLKAEIDKIDTKTQAKLKSLEDAEDGPVDEAGLFVSWIGCYERAERLLATAEMRRSAILKELDDHRQGLGQRLRHACDEIIDGDFDEVVVPAQEGSVPPAPTPNAVVETAVILATGAPTPSVPAASIAPSAGAPNPARPAGPASDPVTPTETATSVSDTPTIPIKSITSRPTQGPPHPPDKTVTSGLAECDPDATRGAGLAPRRRVLDHAQARGGARGNCGPGRTREDRI